MSNIADHCVFDIYSQTDHIARFAAVAHMRACNGNYQGALDELLAIRAKYGDLFGVGCRLDDAIKALEAAVKS